MENRIEGTTEITRQDEAEKGIKTHDLQSGDKKSKYQVGFTACYISDHKDFIQVCEIPAAAALAWAQSVLPDARIGASGQLARYITVSNDGGVPTWLNKLFVIVDKKWDDSCIAIYKHDFSFYLYRTKTPKENT